MSSPKMGVCCSAQGRQSGERRREGREGGRDGRQRRRGRGEGSLSEASRWSQLHWDRATGRSPAEVKVGAQGTGRLAGVGGTHDSARGFSPGPGRSPSGNHFLKM